MKTKLTNIVEYLVYRHLYLNRGYRLGFEVTIPSDLFKELKIKNGVNSGLPIVDIMGITKRSQVICVEIKTTLADFKSKNGHNFYGNYNYYAVPTELVDKVKSLIPPHVGLIRVDTIPYVIDLGDHTRIRYKDPRVVKNAQRLEIDYAKTNSWTGKTILEQIQYNIITAQTSSLLTLMKNNLESEQIK